MTAFFELLQAYAIFFYIAGVLFVLFGIKMLFDARRAGRTTLFTLEQEQASDRAFRAVLVMLGATVFIGAVAGINAFVAPVVPTPEPDQVSPTAIPFTPPVFLPTATPQPTLTLPPPTSAPTVPPTPGGATQTPPPPPPTAVPPVTVPVELPTALPSLTPSLIYLAPTLNVPPPNDSIGSNRIRFSWGVDANGGAEVPAVLTDADRFYRLVITYTSRTTNEVKQRIYCTKENSIDRRTGMDIDDYRSDALDARFVWTVTVVQSPGADACSAGNFTPLSPTRPESTFFLP
jgi:hypothetical protein